MKTKLWKVGFCCILIGIICSNNSSAGTFDSGVKQDFTDKQSRQLSIGARNTLNIFTIDAKTLGTGSGASFRIQLMERINTEWFADVINSNLYNKANRIDKHIGWNVMFYLLNPNGFTRKFTPFLAAGHCFDYTGIRLNGENTKEVGKWTSAVQMSLGTHYNLTPRFDITLCSLYDLHLGKELEAELNSNNTVSLAEYSNAGWEAHVMFILSVNYKIAKLWNAKK